MKCLNLSRHLQAPLLKGREQRLKTNHQIMQWAKNHSGSPTMLLSIEEQEETSQLGDSEDEA